jgi:hypothetical protein
MGKYFSAADLHGEQIKRRIGKVEITELRKDGTTKKNKPSFSQRCR